MELLTNSRQKDARACLRLHHLKYRLGFRSTQTASALRFGSLVHLGLEAWCNAKRENAPPLECLLRAQAILRASDADPYERAMAEAMLVAYHARWIDAPLDVLNVEVQFETPLRNPATGWPSKNWRLAGKIDAIVRSRLDGRVYILEHKTASDDVTQGSDYWRKLRMDGQISQYYLGAESLGYEVAGCIYDVLKKPGQRPLKANSRRAGPETPEEYGARIRDAIAESPEQYFQRGTVVRLEAEMQEAMADIWETAQLIRRSELLGMNPRNPDACFRWNRPCEFFDVCTGAASLDDIMRFVKSESVHPELEVKELGQ